MIVVNKTTGKKKKCGDSADSVNGNFHCSISSLLTLLWITFGFGVSVGFMIMGFIAR